MNRLVAIVTDDDFVDAIKRCWDQDDAVLPVDPRLPGPAVAELLDEMAPAAVVEAGSESSRSNSRPVESGDALVMATSGTTGSPKGVVLTHDAIVASARATSAYLEVDSDRDQWLACLPLAHVGGLSVVTRSLITGTPFTVQTSFDAEAVEAAAKDGATLVSLVPTMAQRCDTSAFRKVVLGGGSPPKRRPANTHITYGLTETGSGVVYDHQPLDGVELRCLDGEVQVRGPMLCRGYRDGSTPIADDGWLATRDAGEIVDGRLNVFGRMGDMIKTGGENVWPTPVERILAEDPAVTEAAVIGRPDPDWGQRVTAVIVANQHAKPELAELRERVKAQLPAYCAPQAIEIVTAFPRTSLGKIARSEL